MAGSKHYYTLVASLPYLPIFYQTDRLPINRQRLDQRLGMLEPDDKTVVSLAEEFIKWQRQPVNQTNEEIARFYQRMMNQVTQPVLRDMIDYRLSQRTIMVALRYRQRGLPLPRGKIWGVGRWVRHIEIYWEHPDFKLSAVHPWIVHARQLLESNSALELEKLLMKRTWEYLDRISEVSNFRFESVLAYIFQWDITQRWLLYSREIAQEQLKNLVVETLSEYKKIF